MNISKIAKEMGVKRQIIYRVLYGKKMRLTNSFLHRLTDIINAECSSNITISDLKKGIYLSPTLRKLFQSSPARKSRVLSVRVSHLRCFASNCAPMDAAFLGKTAGVSSSSAHDVARSL